MDKNILINDLLSTFLDNIPSNAMKDISDLRLLTMRSEIRDIIGFHTKGIKNERQLIKQGAERTLHA